MRYFPLTDADREEMRKCIGVKQTGDLFADLPQDKIYYSLNDFPQALAEDELIAKFKEIAQKNKYRNYLSFLGAGAYHHFIPEVVEQLSQKSEFLTPYTPYQPEVSQGSLQAMFEYQTMLTMLTGMDVANASLYDGGTASAEAVLLALRKSQKKRILLAASLHPEYREIINTYLRNLDYEIVGIDFDPQTGQVNLKQLEEKIDRDTAGFLFQSPNFLGVVEASEQVARIVHTRGAYTLQATAEAISLAFLTPPAKNGVDIIIGEAQSFGLPLGFGGPYLGFMAAHKDFIRQMPGRIVGQTIDKAGNRGYVLTLSTREQHIKREKATSNICTNQAWCALRAGMYLCTMGKKGLNEIARINHLNTAYFVREIAKFSHVDIKYKKNFFNEVVLEIKNKKADDFTRELEKKGILAGIPLEPFYPNLKNAILVNFTELHKKSDIDRLITAIGELR